MKTFTFADMLILAAATSGLTQAANPNAHTSAGPMTIFDQAGCAVPH